MVHTIRRHTGMNMSRDDSTLRGVIWATISRDAGRPDRHGFDTVHRLRLRPLIAALACLPLLLHTALAREVVDSAGRKVEVPDRIARVMAAGPPASVLIYMLAPQKMIGWVIKPRDAVLPYLLPDVRGLPEIGRLTGRGGTASVEAVMAAKPDVIVDFGSVNPTYVSLADRVQSQTGIPYLLIDGKLSSTAGALRLLGSIIGTEERAGRLAARTQEILGDIDQLVHAVPDAQRPHVYLARRADGLETGNRGSINTEIIERAGGINVVDANRERGGLVSVSLEQVLAWNPDTIVTTDRNFTGEAKTVPAWANVEAVRRGRIFLSPTLPYGWIDEPPSLNRLLGLQWLGKLFFPDRYKVDVRAEAKNFYQLFYQVELTDSQLDQLLEGAR
jgi:iron complex transport system substrate-binding protein